MSLRSSSTLLNQAAAVLRYAGRSFLRRHHSSCMSEKNGRGTENPCSQLLAISLLPKLRQNQPKFQQNCFGTRPCPESKYDKLWPRPIQGPLWGHTCRGKCASSPTAQELTLFRAKVDSPVSFLARTRCWIPPRVSKHGGRCMDGACAGAAGGRWMEVRGGWCLLVRGAHAAH